MAHEKFPVEILSPEGEVWSGEVEMVSTRTTVGSIGLLANHEPVLAMLDPTELRLYESESEGERTEHSPGTFSWADLGTTDPEGAKAFYTGLLGWEPEDNPIPGDGGVYTV